MQTVSAVSISTRTRFEVFKRDAFTCRYCGRKSPEVVLELDHIIAVASGGSDERMNLATSCWDCNRGKSDKPLTELITGENPLERIAYIQEQEKQLAAYNKILAKQRKRQNEDLQSLVNRWCEVTYKREVRYDDLSFLKYCVRVCPVEQVLIFMDIAEQKGIRRLQYVSGCLKNWLGKRDKEAEETA